MPRTGRSLLVAGLLPIASLLAAAAAAAQPAKIAPPPAPTAPQEPRGVVPLPFRSLAATRTFVDTAILRCVCSRSYAALHDGGEMRCSDMVVHKVQNDGSSVSWSFQRRSPDPLHTLELVAARSTATGGYDLHLLGISRDASGKEEPNPELVAIEIEIEQLLKDLSSAPLGRPGDGLLSYQLSYVQGDRAVAVLKTLGYAVIEYTKKGSSQAPTQTVFDNIFEQIPALGAQPGGTLRRPVIIKLADSEETSLVEKPLEDQDPELAGGQRLDSIPDAAPQQRLLIVYDKNDRDSLDLLVSRLEQQIDVPARQILIEALVIELNHDRLLDLGIEVEGKKDNVDLSFEREAGGLLQPLILNFTRPSPRTLLELSARLRALVERGQATVLSRPSVFVLDGRQARIKVGENVPYTKKVEVGSAGLIFAETAYLKTGIILNLRPRAAADNSEVTMQVEAIISSPGPSQVVPGLGALVAPNLQSRQIQTLVKVANDTPFVIGGLIAQNDQHSVSGIPGLSKIRFLNLGALFRKRNVSSDRREVIVVITPHIVAADDPTYAYTIPRDAVGADAGRRAAGASSPSPAGDATSCELKSEHKVFDPKIERTEPIGDVIVTKLGLDAPEPSPGKFQESIFDSLDSQLFRSIYRLRGSDIFDLRFITQSADVHRLAARARDLAERKISTARFSEVPRIDRPRLEKEVLKRLIESNFLEEDRGQQEVKEANERFVKSFLTFFEGGAPGEDILVRHMMIRLIEKLDFSRCVSPDDMIYFPAPKHRAEEEQIGFDPEHLTESQCIRECLKEGTLVLAFPPRLDSINDFLKKPECLGPNIEWLRLEPLRLEPLRLEPDKASCKGQEPVGANTYSHFSPPMVRLACVRNTKKDKGAGYLKRLHDCNEVDTGDGGWRTILLDPAFERRGRNSIGLLQSVLALERLLDINNSQTFPQTLRDFHVGRELVLPTREGLQTRRHLIDRDTARLYYETLDYYNVFAEMYDKLAIDFECAIGKAEKSFGKARGPC
jgi:hypothetical protein